MRFPKIHGLIRRRLLVNFRIDRDVIQRHLPAPFRPKLHDGYAIAGICLIRLENIRPKGIPRLLGLTSENAAHRVAVVWEDRGATREGVYIPRRDTGSWINHLAGGRIFPGEHHRAAFEVIDRSQHIELHMRTADGDVQVDVSGHVAQDLPATSIFRTVSDASAFFEPGSLGYSATADPRRLDGLELKTYGWKVEPLEAEQAYSSYFADEALFPAGSVTFDCALLMRNIPHEWKVAPDLHSEVGTRHQIGGPWPRLVCQRARTSTAVSLLKTPFRHIQMAIDESGSENLHDVILHRLEET